MAVRDATINKFALFIAIAAVLALLIALLHFEVTRGAEKLQKDPTARTKAAS